MKIPVSQYKKLKPGNEYTFKTFGTNGSRVRRGLLIEVTTQQDGAHLVGSQLQFEPLGDDAWSDFHGERLKVYSITTYRGMFEIFNEVE